MSEWQEFLTANWGWITYVVMAVVPVLVGLLQKASWHPIVKAVMVAFPAILSALVSVNVADLPWTAAEVLPFIGSLLGTSWVIYIGFIKSFPKVNAWFDAHGIHD